MKSRRRIAFLKAQDHANRISDYSRDLRPAEWGSVISLHSGNPEPLMSALGQKQTLVGACPDHVGFTPKGGHSALQGRSWLFDHLVSECKERRRDP
jgi:hypothetical protein